MWDVLYEDNHLLVINKPAMWVVQGAEAAEEHRSLLAAAKQYIKRQYHKPGNVYLGVVSRIDAPVTGVVVFARTSKAADRLSRQFRERQVTKTYLTLVSAGQLAAEGVWEDWVRKNDKRQRMQICQPTEQGAQFARLQFQHLNSQAGVAAVTVVLETGRKHQIRLQFAERGHLILGDRKYGSRQTFPKGIALHARSLKFEHPTSRRSIECTAPLPSSWEPWQQLLSKLG